MDFFMCEYFPCNVGARFHLTHLSAGLPDLRKLSPFDVTLLFPSIFLSVIPGAIAPPEYFFSLLLMNVLRSCPLLLLLLFMATML